MCSISQILNPKPKTEHITDMQQLDAGQRMALGHGYILNLVSRTDANTGNKTEFFYIQQGRRFMRLLKINSVINIDALFNENTGIRITPISKSYTKNILRVSLFIELTRSLDLAG